MNRLMCDISDYQFAYSARRYARTGRGAIMIKACEHVSSAGALTHEQRARDSHDHGVRVVHYAFIRAGSGTAQGEYLVERVSRCWVAGDVLCADIEDTSLSEDACTIILREWREALQKHGHTEPIGYSGRAYLTERHLGPHMPHGWIVAEYANRWAQIGEAQHPSRADIDAAGGLCLGRQFTNGTDGPNPHTCAGITGPVDCTWLTDQGVARILKHA